MTDQTEEVVQRLMGLAQQYACAWHAYSRYPDHSGCARALTEERAALEQGIRAAIAPAPEAPALPPAPTDRMALALVFDMPDTADDLLPAQRAAAIQRGRERYASLLAAMGAAEVPGVIDEVVPVDEASSLMKLIRAAHKSDPKIADAYGGLLADRMDEAGLTGRYVREFLEVLRGERQEQIVHLAAAAPEVPADTRDALTRVRQELAAKERGGVVGISKVFAAIDAAMAPTPSSTKDAA